MRSINILINKMGKAGILVILVMSPVILLINIKLGADNDKLRKENAALREAHPDETVPATTNGKSGCTMEVAKKAFPEKYEANRGVVGDAVARFIDTQQEAFTLKKSSELLPVAPSTLGLPPTIEVKIGELIPAQIVYQNDSGCQPGLSNENKDGARWMREVTKYADWRYVAANAMKVWKEYSERDRSEGFDENWEDSNTGTLLTVGDREDDIIPGDKATKIGITNIVIKALANDSKTLQWVLGLAKVNGRVRNSYIATRIRRLYAASKTDFMTLDVDERTARAELKSGTPIAEKFDFGRGENYFKGLLLRGYRRAAAFNLREGDAWIKDVRAALRNIAKGLDIELSG